MDDRWQSGNAYERFMGRWGRMLAREFLEQKHFTRVSKGEWLDLGCGTGALTQAILNMMAPERVLGTDFSADFAAYARQQIQDHRAQFVAADATRLPFADGQFDMVVSGLALNFMPETALDEMRRVLKAGGRVAAYVWDYADKMEWLRYFWDAVVELDPAAEEFDEGKRFPICNPDKLAQLFAEHGLWNVRTGAIDITTHFDSFDDYWEPFLCRQFPAPVYVASLGDEQRNALRELLRRRLPIKADGSIDLVARAWAVVGTGA